MKAFQYTTFLGNKCDIWIFIYDRKAGENVGGKNGQGYFKITDSDANFLADGRWTPMLEAITLESIGSKGKKMERLITLFNIKSRIGKTFSGSSAGQNFSDLLIGKRGMTWY